MRVVIVHECNGGYERVLKTVVDMLGVKTGYGRGERDDQKQKRENSMGWEENRDKETEVFANVEGGKWQY